MDSAEQFSVRTGLEIAVVGMAARFPGSRTIDEFWQNLRDGVEGVRFFSDDEWLSSGGDAALLHNPRHVKAEAAINDIEFFDASFFGFSTRDAQLMDPQQRLFLESAYTAIEDAGYNVDDLSFPVGVYAGAGMNRYLLFNILPECSDAEPMEISRAMLNNGTSALSTRISYKLNLSGPSLFIQTACSTSLVAIHQACQDLLNDRCDMALAGGVSLNPARGQGYFYLEEGPISADGHCRAFDAAATGTIPGDGVGVVVLKRLEDALAGGDHIRAVIKGSAINNDGSAKVGFMAPSVQGQATVINTALALADVSADTINYIEAHGTATPMGDPIEIAALQKAFSAYTERKGFCAIGSVKTNIGHTDAAAGVAGFIKTVLALENRQIPPSLHFQEPNPHIDFANSPFYVNAKLSEWNVSSGPRRAGVSAFGIGGTNAHVILEEAPKCSSSRSAHSWQLLVLSAKTKTALATVNRQMTDCLRRGDELSLTDVAYTLQMGRKAFPYRQAVVCDSFEDAIQSLQVLAVENLVSSTEDLQERSLAFLFPGGGAQYVAMGLELYQTQSVFRQNIDLCADILRPHLGMDLREILYPAKIEVDASRLLNKPSLLLAATFSTEYALAQLWISLGVRPSVMIGHSLGEYTAACLADVMSLPDALALVALRGHLYERITNGATLIVPLSEQEVQPFLAEGISVAAINGLSSCVVSGLVAAVVQMEQELQKHGVSFHRLQADGAAHSSLLDPHLEDFRQAVGRVELRTPTIPFVSNLTGTWITTKEATDPSYWTRQLRQTVRFAEGLSLLLQIPDAILLEVGPGQTLSKLARNHPEKASTCLILPSMRHPHDPQSDVAFWLRTIGQLWLANVSIDWRSLYGNEQRSRLSLPTYPFERHYYWIKPELKHANRGFRSHESTQTSSLRPFSTVTWKRALPPLSRSVPAQEKPWLVFAGEDVATEAMLQVLEQANPHLIKVTSGEKFQNPQDDHYTLDLLRQSHYMMLYEELARQMKLPDTVIFLWDAMTTSPVSGEEPSIEESLADAFSYLYCFARSFAEESFANSFQFWLCSTHLYDVLGNEIVVPTRSLARGLCETLAQEYKNITCRVIDLDLLGEGAAASAWHIVDEIRHTQLEHTVAYRRGHRWLPLSEPVVIDRNASLPASIHSDGCYLLTNGLSETGYKLAEHLTRLAQIKLVLVDHEDLPPRDEWQGWLNSSSEATQNFPGEALPQLVVDFPSQYHYIQYLEEKIEADEGVRRLASTMLKELDTLGALYVCEYFRNNGILLERGRRYRKQSIKETLRIIPKFDKFFETFLALLEAEAIIASEGEYIEFLKHARELEDINDAKTRLEAAYPDCNGYLSLLEYAVQHYNQGLSGAIETANILFPDGTYSLLQSVADQNMKFSYANIYPKVIAETVYHITQEVQQKKKIRILEVGAGQGYLTWLLASKLRNQENVEYFFTDIARSFVIKAEKRARLEDFNWMRFGVLDIAQDPVEQGYDSYSFDMVIEYDVIHATKDIAAALQHIKKLLAPGGLFFSVQAPFVRWTSTLIWGFAEGWWNFVEDEFRKDNLSAVLDYETWEKLLEDQQYQDIHLYPQDRSKRSYVDRMLIVARQQQALDCKDYMAWRQEQRDRQASLQRSKIEKVLALEKAGAQALVASGRNTPLHQIITSAQKQFGNIHGVFHITSEEALNETTAIRDINRSELIARLRPSLQDVMKLEEAFSGKALDFIFWILPGREMDSTEVLLHSFADSFAMNRCTSGTNSWMSLQWDLLKQSPGDLAASEEAARKILTYLLSRPDISCLKIHAHSRVSLGDETGETQATPLTGYSSPGTEADHTRERPPQRRPNLRQPYIPPRDETERIIANLWGKLLGGIEVGINDNFFELGGESLLATQFVSKLRDLFQVEISIRTFFENATIEGITRAISEAKKAESKPQLSEIVALPRVAKRDGKPAQGFRNALE